MKDTVAISYCREDLKISLEISQKSPRSAILILQRLEVDFPLNLPNQATMIKYQ